MFDICLFYVLAQKKGRANRILLNIILTVYVVKVYSCLNTNIRKMPLRFLLQFNSTRPTSSTVTLVPQLREVTHNCTILSASHFFPISAVLFVVWKSLAPSFISYPQHTRRQQPCARTFLPRSRQEGPRKREGTDARSSSSISAQRRGGDDAADKQVRALPSPSAVDHIQYVQRTRRTARARGD